MIKKEATLEMGSLGSSNFTLIAKFVSSQPPPPFRDRSGLPTLEWDLCTVHEARGHASRF